MKGTCVTSFVTEMLATGLKTSTKNEIVSSANDVMSGTTIIMALITTSPTGTILWSEDAMKGGGGQAFLS
jgi:hypothetical protein